MRPPCTATAWCRLPPGMSAYTYTCKWVMSWREWVMALMAHIKTHESWHMSRGLLTNEVIERSKCHELNDFSKSANSPTRWNQTVSQAPNNSWQTQLTNSILHVTNSMSLQTPRTHTYDLASEALNNSPNFHKFYESSKPRTKWNFKISQTQSVIDMS